MPAIPDLPCGKTGHYTCLIPSGFEISGNYIHLISTILLLSISCLEFVKNVKAVPIVRDGKKAMRGGADNDSAPPPFLFLLK